MILTRLKELCKQANKGDADISEELIEEFGELCKDAMRKQFTPHEKEFKIRMSQLGKNIRQQQCELLDLPKDEDDEYNMVIKFMYGDMIEALLVVLMKAAGVEIQEEQTEVTLNIEGEDVSGTLDIVAQDKVWDIKSASPYAFENKFSRGFQAVDEQDTFGYVTQLYLYSEATGRDVGGWIVMNKVNGEIEVVEAPIADNIYRKKHLDKASENVRILLETKSIEDVDDSIPSVAETHYRKPTGKRILDPEYNYFDFKNVLWGDRIYHGVNKLSKAKNKPKRFYVKREK